MPNYELFGAQGLIYEKRQVVLVRRRTDNLWAIPGGNIEEGETPESAAIREVKEETGLDVQIVDLIGVYRRPLKEAFGKKGDETRVYLCREIGGIFTINNEVSEIRRFNVNKLPDNLTAHHKQRIVDARYCRGKPFYRLQ